MAWHTGGAALLRATQRHLDDILRAIAPNLAGALDDPETPVSNRASAFVKDAGEWWDPGVDILAEIVHTGSAFDLVGWFERLVMDGPSAAGVPERFEPAPEVKPLTPRVVPERHPVARHSALRPGGGGAPGGNPGNPARPNPAPAPTRPY